MACTFRHHAVIAGSPSDWSMSFVYPNSPSHREAANDEYGQTDAPCAGVNHDQTRHLILPWPLSLEEVVALYNWDDNV